MTHRHVIILTCDARPDVDGRRCAAYFIGPSSSSIAAVREAAGKAGWGFKPGPVYRQIDGQDKCPEHNK
jgi:hypothetical protein